MRPGGNAGMRPGQWAEPLGVASRRIQIAVAPETYQPRTQAAKTRRNGRGMNERAKSEAYPRQRYRGDCEQAETVCQACGMQFFARTARMHEKECQKRKVLRETKVTIDMIPDLIEEMQKKLDNGTNDCADAIRTLYIISLKPNMAGRLMVGNEGNTGILQQLARVACIDSGGSCGQSGALKIMENLLKDKENFALAIEAELPKHLMAVVKSRKHGPLRVKAVEILKQLATDPSLTTALFAAGFSPALGSHTKAIGNAAVARQSKRAVSTMKKRASGGRDKRPIQVQIDSALYT